MPYTADGGCHIHYLQLERYYHDIVQCLKLAESICVPTFRVGFHKHWWSPQLDDMKKTVHRYYKLMDIHRETKVWGDKC